MEILRSELESKLRDARELNDSLRSEIDRIHEDNARSERELRAELDAMASRSSGDNEWKTRYESLERAHQDMKADLLGQERTNAEVRQEAMGFLSQMKTLAQRTDASSEREEQLVHRVHNLESEIKEWKSRYAKIRTQLGDMRSGSMPMPVPNARQTAFNAPDGLVKDVFVTRFQLAIDELLRSAHSKDPQLVLGHVKDVVVSVRNISLATGDISSSAQDEHSQQIVKQRNKMSATSTNLITAAKNFAFSHGLAPVSLLDAAASHLSASVIELLHTVKTCPTPPKELEHDDMLDQHNAIADSTADYYGTGDSRTSHNSNADSQYSPIPTPSPQKPIANDTSDGIRPSAGTQPNHGSYRGPEAAQIEELKVRSPLAFTKPISNHYPFTPTNLTDHHLHQTFLDTRTTSLLTSIQTLVTSIRTSAPPPDILDTIVGITTTTSQIIKTTAFCITSSETLSAEEESSHPAIVISQKLADGVERLEQKGREGEEVGSEEEWAGYVRGLPPLAFEIAREVRELGGWVEGAWREGHGNGDGVEFA